MEIILLSIVVGSIGGIIIGNFKGRLGAGLILGTVLGPIGWIILLLGPDTRPRCDACRGPILPGATRCMHCASTVHPMALYTCPACGEVAKIRQEFLGGEIQCHTCHRVFRTDPRAARALA